MAIDFSFPEEIELIRQKVREYCDQVVRPAEKEIAENRMISAAQLAREASADGGPVQPSAPWSICLGRENYADLELARLLKLFGVTLEHCEEIGEQLVDWSGPVS